MRHLYIEFDATPAPKSRQNP